LVKVVLPVSRGPNSDVGHGLERQRDLVRERLHPDDLGGVVEGPNI
jgi:hypothetical protein